MATALEPCPFCRSTHLHLAHSGLDYCVVCESCKSKGPHQEDLESAISRWNQTSHCTEAEHGMAPEPEESFTELAQPLARCSAARG